MGLIIRYGGDITSEPASSYSGLGYNKSSNILENTSVVRRPSSEAQQRTRSINKQYHNLTKRSISTLENLGYNVRQT